MFSLCLRSTFFWLLAASKFSTCLWRVPTPAYLTQPCLPRSTLPTLLHYWKNFEFHASSVSLCVIENRQVKMDPEEIRAMGEWARPTTRKQLQHFLGFPNFHQGLQQSGSQLNQIDFSLNSILLDPRGWPNIHPNEDPVHFSSCPDPVPQVIVEVDVSGTEGPCVFYASCP